LNFYITRAKPEDRDAVLNLSKHFSEDYLEYTVDRWIEQEPGGLYLAWSNNLLTGCCSLYFPSSSEAWLQGMRVHPDYQGRGLAYKLNRYLIEQAKARGAETARLLTARDNHRALRVAKKLGFTASGGRREIIFRKPLHHVIALEPDQISPPRLCKPSEVKQALLYLNANPSGYNAQGLLFGPGYSYRRLRADSLEEAVKNDRVYLFGERNRIEGIMVVLPEISEGHLIIAYLNAPLENLPSIRNLFAAWFKAGYQQYTLNLLPEQHRVLMPVLKQLFGNYNYEQWLLMEKDLSGEH